VDVQVTTNNGASALVAADRFTYTSTPAPAVTGLSPATGTTAGGTSVTVTGTNFTGATAVNFGSVVLTSFTINSDTSITATAPAQAAGTVDVTVTTPNGVSTTSAADQFTYTLAPLPSITSLGTTTGTTAGGTSVTLTGTNFTGATGVWFGSVAATSFTVVSATQLTATAPPQPVGTIDVTVTSYSGTSATSTADRFSYTAAAVPAVTSLSATSGTTAGGTSVTLTGSGFTAASAVLFGSVAASFTINSDTSITATATAQAAGTVDITVTTPTGTSASTSADRFTYNAAAVPAVTSLSATTGTTAGGTSVTLTGSGFTAATGVRFGAVAAAFTVNSDTSITATAPAQAAGTVHVTVTTYSGTSSTSPADQFTYTAASAPVVNGITATSGSAIGGANVTVTGSGFTGATGVSFGSVPALAFTVLSDTALTALAPPGTAGTVDVTVSTYSGTSALSAADQFTYTSVPVPALTSLNPSTGSTGGGTLVTITGSNFTNATAVLFGSTPALAFTIVSDSIITALAPPQPASTLDVTVIAFGNVSALSAADRYMYTPALAPAVTGVSPATGSTAGGTVVTITGSSFTGASTVLFGQVPATFTINSDTSITATAPSQAGGTVDVFVLTPNGTSAAGTSDRFTYTAAAAPVVSGITPSSGSTAGGLVVTVTGSGFTGATGVNFGSVAATFTVNSDTRITATVPAQAAGTVDVTVITPSGTSARSAADQFTYTAAAVPVVSGLNPSSGPTGGGTLVTITGSGFSAATAVNFGSSAALGFTVVSDTVVRATAPPGTFGPPVDVTVVTPSGTSATSAADQFSYTTTSVPSVTGLSPASGSTAGGTVVVVTGSGFTGATAVAFGAYPATTFTVNSDTQITAVAPAQPAGTVDVTITTAAGTSSTGAADRFTYTAAAAPSVTAVSPNAGPPRRRHDRDHHWQRVPGSYRSFFRDDGRRQLHGELRRLDLRRRARGGGRRGRYRRDDSERHLGHLERGPVHLRGGSGPDAGQRHDQRDERCGVDGHRGDLYRRRSAGRGQPVHRRHHLGQRLRHHGPGEPQRR
jgi:hypothetical protein